MAGRDGFTYSAPTSHVKVGLPSTYQRHPFKATARGKRRGVEEEMERKRWRALALLLVAFLFSNAVLSARSAVAAAAVYLGSSRNGSDVKCQVEEEAEFHFGSEIEWGILEAPTQFLYRTLGRPPICGMVNGKPNTCLTAANTYRRSNCGKDYYRCARPPASSSP